MAHAGKQTKILVVEDEVALSETVVYVLENNGQNNISVVANVKAAIEKISNQRFDCVLLDLGLGSESGEKVVKTMRKNLGGLNLNTPVLVMTGSMDGPTAKRLLPLINGVLIKPFSAESLVEKVNHWLKNRDLKDFRKVNLALNSNAKVLIVEDEKDYGEILEDVLSSNGLTVVNCNDPSTALQKSKNMKFDCVILDRNLAGQDCRVFLEKMRTNTGSMNEKTPVIVITGQLDDAFIEALKDEIEVFLQKPFEPEVLLGHIEFLKHDH